MKKAYIKTTGTIKVNGKTINVSQCTSYTSDDAEITIKDNNGEDYKLGFPYSLPVILQ